MGADTASSELLPLYLQLLRWVGNEGPRLPHALPALGLNVGGAVLVEHMAHDKKMDAGTLPFLLMRGIGETFVDKTVALADVAAFLDDELRA